MKVICLQCQTENAADSQFCSQCGAKLGSEMDSTITFAGPIEVTEEEHIDFDGLSNEGPLLVVVKGIGVGQTFNIIEDVLVIGRDPKSDIFLDDITVSRKHAVINRESGELRISDTGSLNGTYVNHERVDKVKMVNRDELQIGKFKMIFIDKQGVGGGA